MSYDYPGEPRDGASPWPGVGSLDLAAGLGVNVPKVHYDDGRIFVEVRNPGEWHEVRDFIQPTSPDIVRIVSSFSGS